MLNVSIGSTRKKLRLRLVVQNIEVSSMSENQKNKFKIMDRVLIKGELDDFTEHLDGKIGMVAKVYDVDCEVYVPGYNTTWLIWNKNMTLVGAANG